MTLRHVLQALCILPILTGNSLALSPTDNYRQHCTERRTGELAYVADGIGIETLQQMLEEQRDGLAESMAEQKVSNLSLFALPDVNGKTLLLAHRYDPVSRKPSLLAWPESLRETLNGHEHAARQRHGETTWLDMELICHLPCAEDVEPEGEVLRMALVTELRPEKEEHYRTLHQTVWPGVIDQLTRSKYRHWTTWCTEIGGKIYLIAYVEYVGSDLAADNADMASDPTTVRWWKHTDACQRRLPQQPENAGMWSAMDLLIHLDGSESVREKENQ